MTDTQKQRIREIASRALDERRLVLANEHSYAHLAGYMTSALEQILDTLNQ